ncbi:MAG: Panacea domain-containing protein [Hyphomicrobium sp.]
MSDRLEKVIHYVIWATPPEHLGATKLAKILWFSDVEYYRAAGQTVTLSDNYQKRDQGPLHADFYSSISKLKAQGKIADRKVPTPVGFRCEYLWLEQPDMREFNGQELAVLHSVIEQIKPMTAKQVSDLSHVEPWESACTGERLPVAAAAVLFGPVDDDDMAWAEQEFHAVCATA